jgi:hypothetical protein
VVNDNTEEIGHSFHASGVNAQGDLFIVWLDDRGGNHIPKDGARPQARGLYYAVLPDGRPEAPLTNHLIRPHSVCDCCRPALAFEPDGDALLLTRLADGGLRDHGLFRLGREGKAAFIGMSPADKWRIEACPHHGPAMANADGRLHAVWFTGADTRQGLFYAVSSSGRPARSLRRSSGCRGLGPRRVAGLDRAGERAVGALGRAFRRRRRDVDTGPPAGSRERTGGLRIPSPGQRPRDGVVDHR